MENPLLEIVEWVGGSTALVGLVTFLYLKDSTAASKCRKLVYDYKDKLESFVRYLTFTHRNPQGDLPKLKELKDVLQQIKFEMSGLLFGPRSLSKSLKESDRIFSRIGVEGPSNKPHMIAAMLTVEWGIKLTPPYESVKLAEIQKIFDKPFPIRWLYGIFSWFQPLLNKIPFKVRIERKVAGE